MKKLAIILDSFCARTKSEVEKNSGMFHISLQIEMNGQIFKAGVSKKEDAQIKALLLKKTPSKTSMPTPSDILKVFKKTSKEYENVIYFPLSSAISGTAKMAMGLAQDFDNVSVIESHLVGENLILFSNYLIRMVEKESASIDKVKAQIKEYIRNDVSQAFLVLMSLETLVKSGRLSGVASKILGKIKAIPIVSYEWDNKKLHSKGIKRSPRKAIEFAISKINKFIAGRPNFKYLISTTPDPEIRNIAKEVFNEHKYNYTIEECSPIIIAGVGLKAISISAFKVI